jgi:hypothetical protein
MESIFWLILGITLLVLAVVLICVWTAKRKEGNVGIYCNLTWMLTFWGFWAVVSYTNHLPRHSKNNKLTIEIRQEIKIRNNVKITSTDTLYFFTPKKK